VEGLLNPRTWRPALALILALTFALALMMLRAVPAAADDAGIRQAIVVATPSINSNVDSLKQLFKHKLTLARERRGIRLLKHIDHQLAALSNAIQAQQSSSKLGSQGKSDALGAISVYLQGNREYQKALSALIHHKKKAAKHHIRRAQGFYNKAKTLGHAADALLGLPLMTLCG